MADRDDEREELSRRQQAKKERRDAGDRSSSLAKTLMEIPESTLGKLELGEDLAHAVTQARAIKSNVARRRAERTLAGELRRVDDEELAAIEKRLANVQATGAAEPQLFHAAERWRARLIEDPKAAGEFPGGTEEPMPQLIANARRERDTGKPPGAARALFRHVMATLKKPRIDDD
ncbi:MAG: ribosome biogenesis factor YjgA [Kofleriaceae bacterium]|nr:ribosome biogenesis factor YjgA [Kofleriaceae bacterium]